MSRWWNNVVKAINPVNWIKAIGKSIKQGFKSVGKFINSLGVFGQVGMALIMPGIMNAAVGSLSSMSTGFMANLGKAGWSAGVPLEGTKAGMARMAHAVLQGSLHAGKTVTGTLHTLTDTVVGITTDTTRMVANKVTGNIDPVKVAEGAADISAGKFWQPEQGRQIFENAVHKLEKGWGEFATGAQETRTIFGREYVPNYRQFTVDGNIVNKDVSLPKNKELWEESLEYQEIKDRNLQDIVNRNLPILERKDVIPVELKDRPATMGTRFQHSVMAGDTDPSYIEEVFQGPGGFMGKTSPLLSERSGEEFMMGAPRTRQAFIDAEAATDYSTLIPKTKEAISSPTSSIHYSRGVPSIQSTLPYGRTPSQLIEDDPSLSLLGRAIKGGKEGFLTSYEGFGLTDAATSLATTAATQQIFSPSMKDPAYAAPTHLAKLDPTDKKMFERYAVRTGVGQPFQNAFNATFGVPINNISEDSSAVNNLLGLGWEEWMGVKGTV